MTGFRMGLIASAAAAALAAPMGPALAGTTIYDEDNFSVGDNGIDVTVSGYGSYSGYPISGQVLQITVNGGAPYTVISWCIDFNHNINVPGTYTDYQLVPFTPAGLMSVSTELKHAGAGGFGRRIGREPDDHQRDQLPHGSRQHAAGARQHEHGQRRQLGHPDRHLGGTVRVGDELYRRLERRHERRDGLSQ